MPQVNALNVSDYTSMFAFYILHAGLISAVETASSLAFGVPRFDSPGEGHSFAICYLPVLEYSLRTA